MIAMLKMLALLRDRFKLDSSKKGKPFFTNEEFWILYSDTMKELAIADEDPSLEVYLNKDLAEYVLE